jgi:hypothetical protein
LFDRPEPRLDSHRRERYAKRDRSSSVACLKTAAAPNCRSVLRHPQAASRPQESAARLRYVDDSSVVVNRGVKRAQAHPQIGRSALFVAGPVPRPGERPWGRINPRSLRQRAPSHVDLAEPMRQIAMHRTCTRLRRPANALEDRERSPLWQLLSRSLAQRDP